ncbi:hypothetical protein 7S3_54 [uncultured Caudovirales phage]|uniref:Holliday junction resolvase n=1 Tax=uncultured Caudovirales phage TaxID=2100421 RepID=A0A2H4J2C5_9CAUD|nr:hypothetical protein 7S3_54 [uncultured Caudovirales phage]
MPNANHRKGMEEERQVLKTLRDNGFPHAERTRAGRAEDTGDIHLDVAVGIAPGAICQVKNVRTPDWSGWLEQLESQVRLSGADVGFISAKRTRPGRPPLRLFVMPLEAGVELVRRAGFGEPLEGT